MRKSIFDRAEIIIFRRRTALAMHEVRNPSCRYMLYTERVNFSRAGLVGYTAWNYMGVVKICHACGLGKQNMPGYSVDGH